MENTNEFADSAFRGFYKIPSTRLTWDIHVGVRQFKFTNFLA